jgi:hypothetical protein
MGNPLSLIDPDGREPNDEWKRTIFPNGYVVTEWVSNKGGNEVDYLTTQDMRKTWGDAIKTENLSVRIAQNNGEIRQNHRYEPGLRYDGSPKSGAMEGVDMTDMVPTKAAFAKVGAWSVIKGIAAYRLAKTLLASKADDVTEAVVKKVTTEMTTVGRWMSTVELEKMRKTGRTVESWSTKTDVSINGFQDFMPMAKKGQVYVEFSVPTNSLIYGGKPGWFHMIGPNGGASRKAALSKQGGQMLPEFENLTPVLHTK